MTGNHKTAMLSFMLVGHMKFAPGRFLDCSRNGSGGLVLTQ